MEKILIDAFERAVKLLRERESELEIVARLLFEEEEVEGGQIYSIVSGRHGEPDRGPDKVMKIAGFTDNH